jgi:hypothetical protein
MWRLAGLVLFLPAFVIGAEPTTEQIAQAIRDLGDRSFQVREKAAKFLWQAGEAAELPLHRAAQSGDPEVARRATSILERFDRGELPNVPPDVVDLLKQYPDAATQAARISVLEQLTNKGLHGFRALRRLARSTRHAKDRPLIQALLQQQAPFQTARLIARGEIQEAQEWLEFGLTDAESSNYEHYVAMLYLRQQIPAGIANWKAEPDSRIRSKALVYLGMAARDFAKARSHLDGAGDPVLRDSVALAAGDWTKLSLVSNALEKKETTAEDRCVAIVAFDLAGDAGRLNALVAEIHKNTSWSPANAQILAQTMFAIGRVHDTEKLLRSHDPVHPLLAEIIADRHGDKAALDWTATLKDISFGLRQELELAAARWLFALGQTEAAGRLADSHANWKLEAESWSIAWRWAAMLQAAGQARRADEHACRIIEWLRLQSRDNDAQPFFELIFGADASIAEAWWHYLRVAETNNSAAENLVQVRKILTGAKMESLMDWTRDLTSAWRNSVAGRPHDRELRLRNGPLAAAEALRRAGHDADAEACYTEALRATPAPAAIAWADYLTQKKRFAEAATALDNIWRSHPHEAILLFLRGQALILAGQKNEGENLIERSHWAPLAHLHRRWKFYEQLLNRGLHEHARREVEIALAIGSPLDSYYGRFVEVGAAEAERRGQHAEAARLSNLALALESFVNRSSECRPTFARDVKRRRMMAQVAQGSKDGSLRNYRAIIELTPRTDLVLGAIRAAQGDVRKSVIAASAPALERLDRRCRDFSESAWAANEYAWLAAQMQSNLDTALARATKSVEVEPKNAAYCDTLAEVHFRKGDRTAALKHNQQCLKLQPGNNYYLRQRERFERGEIESVPK